MPSLTLMAATNFSGIKERSLCFKLYIYKFDHVTLTMPLFMAVQFAIRVT